MKYTNLLIVGLFCLLSIINCNPEDLPIEGLTDLEIVEGLKEALKVGTDTATGRLSVEDGYYKDQAVKLLLPEGISTSIENFKAKQINVFGLGTLTGEQIYTAGIPGFVNPLSSKEEDLVLGINRAAESASKEAAPIFVDAITSMSIDDGKTILFSGEDDAATTYLSDNTRLELTTNFEPKIDEALNSVKIGNTSVVSTYEGFTSDYNSILNTKVPTSLFQTESIASLMNLDTIEVEDLSEYSTEKGLDGLFLKVADEEKKIRENPLHRVTSILEKVFGELD